MPPSSGRRARQEYERDSDTGTVCGLWTDGRTLDGDTKERQFYGTCASSVTPGT